MFFLRSVFRFLLPSGLLCLGAGYLQFIAGIPPLLDPYLPLYPWLVTTAGLLLAWRFNRSRVIYVVLLLIAGGWALHLHPEVPFRAFAVSPLTLLLPLNMAFIAFWKERGLLTWWSLLRLAWLGGQAAGVWWLFQWNAAQVTRWLEWSFLPWTLTDWIGMAQIALCIGLLCSLLLLGRSLSLQKPMETGFFWALLALLAAFIQEGQITFWFSTTILILLVAVVETSFSMAFNDELTGLPARRAMNEYLMKLGRRYVVAMVDVDHFKKVNDTHGHDVGDQVLRMIAANLRSVSGGGRGFRYGGEEFVVIFSGKLVAEVEPYLERLRVQIARTKFVVRSRKRPRKKPDYVKPSKGGSLTLKVTVSIGAAERSERLSEAAQVIKEADQALYRAKKEGRNRVCF